MNTKYPLNGRTTTLADLVHEYGAISGWVGNTSSYDTKYDWLTINDSSALPFQKLIFKDLLDNNNNFSAEIPYEIVYFDNVYSTTQKNDTGKLMKIIQQNDTSTFGENTYGWLSGSSYVKAGIVSNPVNIKLGYFGFKFIGASIDERSQKRNQYYYNYKTSQGEATVMYAFRNILDILYNYEYKDKTTSKRNIISDFFMTDYTDSSAFFKDVKNINELINFDTKPYLPQVNAYKYIGDAVWTSFHVQYENYVSIEKNNPIIKKAKALNYLNTQLCQTFDILKKHILKLLSINYQEVDNHYSYNNVTPLNTLLYFFHIFLDSLRFFVSFVTAFRFVKISNKSYLLSEAVLRCDLGFFALYKSVTIKEAVHDYRTALPLDNILPSTKLDIIIKYSVEYENISSISSDITTTINLTWADVVKYSKNNTNSIWFSLRNCVCDDETSLGYINIMQDKTQFGQYAYGNPDYFLTIDNSSLKKLAWPFNESLVLTDIEIFNAIKNNPTYSSNNIKKNYADTSDKNTFNNQTNDEIDKLIKGQHSPFGVLRMHNYLDSENDKSEYWCDISLYRCKNFYIIQENEHLSNINIIIYYSIPYRKILPNVYIRLPNKSFDDAGIDPDSNNAINDKPTDILTELHKDEFKDQIIYSIPNDYNKDVFITASSISAKVKLYASGDTEDVKSTLVDSYVNNLNFILYYLKDNIEWVLAKKDEDYTINPEKTDDTLAYYRFHLNNPNNNSIFWKFKFDEIQLFLYFKTSNIILTNKIELHITTIHVYDDNGATIETRVRALNNVDISLLYLIYHNDNTDELYLNDTTRLNYYTLAFNNTLHIVTASQIFVNSRTEFYIEPISFKMSDLYYYQVFSGGIHDPFNVVYNTNNIDQDTGNTIYKFIQCKTLFGTNLNDRRVKIAGVSLTQTNIYLSLEPIYIFKFGKVTFSDKKDSSTNVKDVEDDCKTYYENNIVLDLFKYKINSGSDPVELSLMQSLNIFSLYTQLIYFDSDLLKISNYHISDDLYDKSLSYLISYNIHILYYDETQNQYIEPNDGSSPISISNGITKSQINEKFRKYTILKNKLYLINVEFTLFKKRTSEIACTFSHSNVLLNGMISITIKELPTEYVGDKTVGWNTNGDNRPIQLPIGCTVEVQDNYKIPTLYKEDLAKWLGWLITYNKSDYITDNPYVFKIQDTDINISIISTLYTSVNITVSSGTTSGGDTTGGN